MSEEQMASTSFKNTSVDISGLLKVLGENLYSRPEVAVRELVQNASDAIHRRRYQGDHSFEPLVEVKCDREAGHLVITDNGSGLTDEEIDLYLARIGSGFTRSLRQDMPESDLIGAFGLGFLTAYMIGKKVVVETTSMSGEAFRFISENGQQYVITPMPPGQTGSRVIIRLKDKYEYLADFRELNNTIEVYCRLMSVPISVQGGPVINIAPPWRQRIANEPAIRRQKRYMEFAGQLEPHFDPICTIPIETETGNGLLWIHDRSTYGGADNRWMQIYIRGMMVAQNKHDFLPAWAGFVSGVFESDILSPTASREDIITDEHYRNAKQQTAERLNQGLAEIALNRPEIWRRILRRHNQALLGAAIADAALFDAIHPDLTLPTSEGDLTLQEIAQQSPGGISIALYADGGADEVVSRAFGTPVVLGYRYGAAPMAVRYAGLNGLDIIELGTKSGQQLLFPDVPVDEQKTQLLTELFGADDLTLVFSEFEPVFLSCLCFVDAEQSLKAYFESDEADENIGHGALRLARAFTRKIEENTPLQMVINLKSPLITALLSADPQKAASAASALGATARMLCKNKALGADGFASALEHLNNSILKLLDQEP